MRLFWQEQLGAFWWERTGHPILCQNKMVAFWQEKLGVWDCQHWFELDDSKPTLNLLTLGYYCGSWHSAKHLIHLVTWIIKLSQALRYWWPNKDSIRLNIWEGPEICPRWVWWLAKLAVLHGNHLFSLVLIGVRGGRVPALALGSAGPTCSYLKNTFSCLCLNNKNFVTHCVPVISVFYPEIETETVGYRVLGSDWPLHVLHVVHTGSERILPYGRN